MKKTALAAAMTAALGVSMSMQVAHAHTGLTGVWTGTYTFTMLSGAPASGVVGTSGPGQSWSWDFNPNSANSTHGAIDIVNTTAFFGHVWTAHDVTMTTTAGNYGPAAGPGKVNMLFDWSVNANIPVTSTWHVGTNGGTNDVGETAIVSVVNAVITPASPAFPGFQPHFTGNLTKVSDHAPAVPLPAAVWLMGSGLLGLVGVARRRRKS